MTSKTETQALRKRLLKVEVYDFKERAIWLAYFDHCVIVLGVPVPVALSTLNSVTLVRSFGAMPLRVILKY